ncbi:MAG: hypothetical protein U0V02_19510 [Anaerolineales bacterium]
MPIRIGLYDFFAYTLPGVLCLVIIGFWINVIGLWNIDFSILNSLSLAALLGIIGIGYIVGLLIEPLAYGWMKLLQQKKIDGMKVAFDEFTTQHPLIKVNFESRDLSILLRAIKSKSMEAAINVEEHNVAAIMLMNLSLVFILSSISTVIYYFAISTNLWILFLAFIFFVAALMTMSRSRTRRQWFYKSVFETFTAHFLLEKTKIVQVSGKKSNASKSMRSRKKSE